MLHEIINMGFHYFDDDGVRHLSPVPVLLDLRGRLLPPGAQPTYFAWIECDDKPCLPGCSNTEPVYQG
jgi:hypothetical protein